MKGGVSQGGQTALFRRAKVSFDLKILALVKGGRQSRGHTGHFGPVKASFGLKILALVKGEVSQGVQQVFLGASRHLSAIIYWF